LPNVNGGYFPNSPHTSDFKLEFKNYINTTKREDPYETWFQSWSGGGYCKI
jgi:hypothetical protein